MFCLVQYQNNNRTKSWFNMLVSSIQYKDNTYIVIPDYYNKINKIMFDDFKEMKLNSKNSINMMWAPFTLIKVNETLENSLVKFNTNINKYNIFYEKIIEDEKKIIYSAPLISIRNDSNEDMVLYDCKKNVTGILYSNEENITKYIPIYLILKAIDKKTSTFNICDNMNDMITNSKMNISIPGILNHIIENDNKNNTIEKINDVYLTKKILKKNKSLGSMHEICD